MTSTLMASEIDVTYNEQNKQCLLKESNLLLLLLGTRPY